MDTNNDLEMTLVEVKKKLEENVQRSEEIIDKIDKISYENSKLASRIIDISTKNLSMVQFLAATTTAFPPPHMIPFRPSAPIYPYSDSECDDSSSHTYETLNPQGNRSPSVLPFRPSAPVYPYRDSEFEAFSRHTNETLASQGNRPLPVLPFRPPAPLHPYYDSVFDDLSSHTYETLSPQVPEQDYRQQRHKQTFVFEDSEDIANRGLSFKDMILHCFCCLCS